MGAVTIIAFLVVHLACWLVQLAVNQVSGSSADCANIGQFACGSGVLADLAGLANRTGDINSVLDAFGFVVDALKTGFSVLVGLVYFRYDWLNGGGAVTDLIVNTIRAIMGSVMAALLIRAALSLRGGGRVI